MRFPRRLFFLAAAAISAPSLPAATLVEYAFTTDLTATTVEPGVTADDIVGSGAFNVFTPGDTTSAGGSSPHLRAGGFGFSPTPAITWTIEPTVPTDALDFSSGSFSFQYHITPSGITNADLQYAINGGGFTTLANISTSRVSAWLSASTSLASIGLLGAGDSISFRFTNGGGSNGAALNLDTFRITGDLQTIPEPSAAMLLGLGLLGCLRFRRIAR